MERDIDRLLLAHTPTRAEPTTQACALTRSQPVSSLRGMTPNSLSHTGQGGRGSFRIAPSQNLAEGRARY